MKTIFVKPATIKRDWFVIDAEGKPLGRVAAKAAQLLRDVDYLVYDVSEMVGYSNPKNFTRFFKKHFGVTPHQYRSPPS